MLDEIGSLNAGQVANDYIGFCLANLQQIGAEVGSVGSHQIFADQIAPVGIEEELGDSQQIVAEGIVGGQCVQLLALDQAVTHQGLTASLDIGRVGDFDVEHVLVAAFAAQFI